MGAYEAIFEHEALVLQPGQSTPEFKFDIQKDEANWGVYWYFAESDGRLTEPHKVMGPRLRLGRYKVRVKFFSPVDPSEMGTAGWHGEILSDPIEFTVL